MSADTFMSRFSSSTAGGAAGCTISAIMGAMRGGDQDHEHPEEEEEHDGDARSVGEHRNERREEKSTASRQNRDKTPIESGTHSPSMCARTTGEESVRSQSERETQRHRKRECAVAAQELPEQDRTPGRAGGHEELQVPSSFSRVIAPWTEHEGRE